MTDPENATPSLFITQLKEIRKAPFENSETFMLTVIGLMTFFGMTLYTSGPAKYFFWGLCVPGAAWLLVKKKAYRDLWRYGPIRWAFGLFLLYLISTIWSVPTTREQQVEILTHAPATAIFVITCLWGLRAAEERKLQFSKFLILSCVLGVVVSLIGFYTQQPIAARLSSPVYLLRGPTKGPAGLLGCLIAAGLLMEEQKARGRAYWNLAGFLAVGAFTVMTQSRGLLISYICLALLWGGYYFGAKRASAAVLVVTVIAAFSVLTMPSLDTAWTHHMSTGLNGRLAIWFHSLQGFLEMPWLGHGSAALFSESISGERAATIIGHEAMHPHSLLFSMLFYFGLAGLLLLTGFLLAVAKQIWQFQDKLKWLAWFALCCLLLMHSTDSHTLVEEVDVQWWRWWLPFLVLISITAKHGHPFRNLSAESQATCAETSSHYG